jgi:hypothetical protein
MAIIAYACAAGPTGPDADALYEVVACPLMQPVTQSAPPLEDVALGQVPETFSPPMLALVETDDAAVSGHAAVRLEAGEATLVAPIHPSGSPDGGQATVWITDGTLSCEPFDFAVEALTPAPGLLADIAGHMQAIVDAQAAALDATRADLIDTPLDEQPAPLLPIAVLQAFLDHPDNDNSLVALANGTAPIASDARLDLLEPLLALTGLEPALAEVALPGAGAAGAPGVAASTAAATTAIGAAFCEPETIGDDAGLLDACMDAAREAQFELGGASGQVLQDMAEFFTYAGMVPALDAAASIAGFITWLALNDKLRTAALLPSTLTSMTMEVGPVEFLEDEAATGSWSNARVTATNIGWDFGKEFLEGLIAAAGAAGVFDKAQITAPVNGTLLAIATGPGVAQLIGDGTLESFQIPPETFGPVDVSSEDWSIARIATGDAVALTSHTQYEPRNAGTATLSVRTRDGEFGGQQESFEETITVGTIQVTISPDDVTLGPGLSQLFTVTVVNSADPEMVEIDDPSGLQGSADIEYEGAGTHTVFYTAPQTPDPNGSVDLLTVRHTAETGARGFSPDERLDIATIRFLTGLRITTPATCLEPGGDPLQIEVEVDGDPGLTWTASAGTISNTGLFTPPSQAQLVTITVALADHPEIEDSIQLQVGGCTCSATLNVGGRLPLLDLLSFQLNAELDAVESVHMITADVDAAVSGLVDLRFGADFLNPQTIPIGTIGGFDGHGQGSIVSESSSTGWINPDDLDDPSIEPLAVVISENTGSIFAGTVSGMVAVGPEQVIETIQMTFHIEADPDLSDVETKQCLASPN